MQLKKLIILQGILNNPSTDSEVITFEQFKSMVLSGKILKHFFHYNTVELYTYKLEYVPYPLFTSLILRLLSIKSCGIKDMQGQYQSITVSYLLKRMMILARDLCKKPFLIKKISREVNQLMENISADCFCKNMDIHKTPVYLRTDLWFGVHSGGSVGHIAGVLNNLDNFSGKPVLLTTDIIPTVREDIKTHLIRPGNSFWDLREVLGFQINQSLMSEEQRMLEGRGISFVFQRYSTNNYSGLMLAKKYRVPFVLEYNGSQIWISRNWGKPLKYEELSERIELLNLRAADLIVVVSQAMMDELLGRGIDKDKILVNPNGVDPERYSPMVDGSSVRKKYGFTGKTVIGFIGTFGRWHGAEVLAEAFGLLLQKYPEYRNKVRLLMIGDGVTIVEVRERLANYNVDKECILSGAVPQEEGPYYLAACDILASPHVPNPDGTPFFGSPTKLIEYMAMGKGIVASNLGQIGQILEHNRTALMVKPGVAESLMLALKELIEDESLRKRLGKEAREEVVAKYTWREHTKKIIEKLIERFN